MITHFRITASELRINGDIPGFHPSGFFFFVGAGYGVPGFRADGAAQGEGDHLCCDSRDFEEEVFGDVDGL